LNCWVRVWIFRGIGCRIMRIDLEFPLDSRTIREIAQITSANFTELLMENYLPISWESPSARDLRAPVWNFRETWDASIHFISASQLLSAGREMRSLCANLPTFKSNALVAIIFLSFLLNRTFLCSVLASALQVIAFISERAIKSYFFSYTPSECKLVTALFYGTSFIALYYGRLNRAVMNRSLT